MASFIVRPLPFVATSDSTTPLAGTVANLNIDPPGMTVRMPTTCTVAVDLGAGPLAYDTIALIGTNLLPQDTITITSTSLNVTTVAYQGSPVAGLTAKTIVRLGSICFDRILKIAITSSQSGYVSVQRLVVGKAIMNGGVNFDYEMIFNDQSPNTNGPGYNAFDLYPVVLGCKFKTDYIKEAAWRSDWVPMMIYAGTSRGILFVPSDQDASTWQTDAVFGFITAKASGKNEYYNGWTIETTMESFAR